MQGFVMGRVTINGTQSQFSCKKSIPLDMWDVKGNCAKGRSKEALQINRELDNIKAQIIKHYQHLSDREAFTMPAPPSCYPELFSHQRYVALSVRSYITTSLQLITSIRMSIFLPDFYKRDDAFYILWLIVSLMLDLRVC